MKDKSIISPSNCFPFQARLQFDKDMEKSKKGGQEKRETGKLNTAINFIITPLPHPQAKPDTE